jgi:hypothetical protein
LIEESFSRYEGCSHEKRIDDSGYPRAILEEGTLCPLVQEIQRTVQVGRGSNRMKSARTTSEAIDGLKNRLQQGIAIDSYMSEAVLEAGRPYSSRASSWVRH